MSSHKYNQNLLIGAAVAAGLLGTLTSLLGSKKNQKGWSDHAKDIANQVLDSGEMVNKKMVLGSLAGGLVGAAAALLLAPKSGADLIKDITEPFSHHGKHQRSNSHKKSASRSLKSHVAHKATSKPSSKKSSSKKSPKRRVATAAKAAVTKETSENKEA